MEHVSLLFGIDDDGKVIYRGYEHVNVTSERILSISSVGPKTTTIVTANFKIQ
jgi:hypothetical protein